mmetsp:Transcript_44869/g.80677  ORF Transcript_44869/g.80677 Transcript_44869/m.80677 type:complete len:226 (+) Transcript_44869:364-1041(+)
MDSRATKHSPSSVISCNFQSAQDPAMKNCRALRTGRSTAALVVACLRSAIFSLSFERRSSIFCRLCSAAMAFRASASSGASHCRTRVGPSMASKKLGRKSATPEPSSSFTFHFPSANCCTKVPVSPFLARKPVRRTLLPSSNCRTMLGQPPKGALETSSGTQFTLSGTGRRSTWAKSLSAVRSRSATSFQSSRTSAALASSGTAASNLIWPAVGVRKCCRVHSSK